MKQDHFYDDLSLWVFFELVLPLLMISGLWCLVLFMMTGGVKDLNNAGFNDLAPFSGLLVFGTYVKIEGELRRADGKRCWVNNSLSHFTLIAAVGLMAIFVVMRTLQFAGGGAIGAVSSSASCDGNVYSVGILCLASAIPLCVFMRLTMVIEWTRRRLWKL